MLGAIRQRVGLNVENRDLAIQFHRLSRGSDQSFEITALSDDLRFERAGIAVLSRAQFSASQGFHLIKVAAI